MEDTLISIDSKYRDINKYPNESKFMINLDKIYKNVVAINLESIEMTNNIRFISTLKQNNYITLYLPNNLCDSEGIKIVITDDISLDIETIKTVINNYFIQYINNNNYFNIYPEKYFYIFYLYNECTITFDFNLYSSPIILKTQLIINKGWYSLYGLVKIIQNYIQINYNERQSFVLNRKNIQVIDLDNGKFAINQITLNIYDTRSPNNIRSDICTLGSYNSTISNNLNTLKTNIYKIYINDITNFVPSNSASGILDVLFNQYGNIYAALLYTLSFDYNVNIVNIINQIDLDTITYYDLPQFQINFNTDNSSLKNNLNYSSFGYYLGYRPINNNFILSPIVNNTITYYQLTGTKYFNFINDDYIFLRINDWGRFDLFNQKILSKIYLRSSLNVSNKSNNSIDKEYVFRQLTSISKLDIELIDYLGNMVDLNGVDFSFTLSLRTQVNVGQKQLFELQNNAL